MKKEEVLIIVNYLLEWLHQYLYVINSVLFYVNLKRGLLNNNYFYTQRNYYPMMRFVDITNDVAFRKIFGNQNKTKALISFLNAVIELPDGKQIIEVTVANTHQLPNFDGGRGTIVDVKAIDQLGNMFIVEMQVAESNAFEKRILYYTSQGYVSQISKGDDYEKLNPAYFVGILSFNVSDNPNYFSCHKVVDVETGEHIIRDVSFHFIELPKFTKALEDLQTSIDQWTYFIKNAENLLVIPDNIQDEGLKEAYQEAERFNWTKEEYAEYISAGIKRRDDIGKFELAEKRAERRAEKRTEQRVRAEEKKIREEQQKIWDAEKSEYEAKQKEMEEQQKARDNERLQTIRNLKSDGIPIEVLAKSFGLSIEEIEKL